MNEALQRAQMIITKLSAQVAALQGIAEAYRATAVETIRLLDICEGQRKSLEQRLDDAVAQRDEYDALLRECLDSILFSEQGGMPLRRKIESAIAKYPNKETT